MLAGPFWTSPDRSDIVVTPPYAELHAHTDFSFLDGASTPDELVGRAVELGLRGLAVTDHAGLYGAVRFVGAARDAGLHPVVGVEIELSDALVPDPGGIVVPDRRRASPGAPNVPDMPIAREGRPARPRPERSRLPGHRAPVKEDLRGVGERVRGP
nr:PHP domain-containing protein [Chloroflexota bacterium]